MNSFREAKPKPSFLELEEKKVSHDWMLRGPARLMLEAYEESEYERKKRESGTGKTLKSTQSQSKKHDAELRNFADHFLDSSQILIKRD